MYPTSYTVDVLPYLEGAEDRFGNPVDAWGAARAEPVYGWAPAGTSEVSTNRHVAVSDLQLYAPPTFRAGPRDRVVVDGKTYEVEGDVEDFTHGPFDFAPGVRVNLKRAQAS